MSTARTIIREEGEGKRLWFAGGGVHIWKATAEETDGAFLLVEDRMTRGKTTPLHIHPNLDETLIVLEGEILVRTLLMRPSTERRKARVSVRGLGWVRPGIGAASEPIRPTTSNAGPGNLYAPKPWNLVLPPGGVPVSLAKLPGYEREDRSRVRGQKPARRRGAPPGRLRHDSRAG